MNTKNVLESHHEATTSSLGIAFALHTYTHTHTPAISSIHQQMNERSVRLCASVLLSFPFAHSLWNTKQILVYRYGADEFASVYIRTYNETGANIVVVVVV